MERICPRIKSIRYQRAKAMTEPILDGIMSIEFFPDTEIDERALLDRVFGKARR